MYKFALAMFFGSLMFLLGHFTGHWHDDAKWVFFCATVFFGVVFTIIGMGEEIR